MNTLLRSASLLALATAALSASAQNLVVNPGFETGTFSGYTTTPAAHGSFAFVSGAGPNAAPHSGTYAAVFGAVGGLPDTISQTLATVPGLSYTVSYYLRNSSPNAGNASLQSFTASFGGVSQTTGVATSTYSLQTFTAIATSSSTTLSLGGYDPKDFYNLDDISVVANPAPEPSALAALGLGAVVLVKRRKRA